MPDPTLCDVCGEPILTEGGQFALPIKDLMTDQHVTGVCCGICGPKVQAFSDGNCQDLELLPGGPLRDYLVTLNQLYYGQRCLRVVTWLAERQAVVSFEADHVLVTVGAVELAGPSLEAVVYTLMGKEDEEKQPKETVH